MFIKKILVAVDFSERSARAFGYALGLARELGADLTLLHVIDPPGRARLFVDAQLGRPLPRPSTSELLDARDQLRALVSSYDHRGLTLHERVLDGDPAASIVATAAEEGDDLIVLATRGRTGAAEVLLGSVARAVASSAPCPVVTLR